jgi:serine/threonine protein kinase
LQEIKELIIGLARGLEEMHSQRVMHRDLKPENIMLRNDGTMQPVIADFGLSTDVDSEDYIHYRCGTPGYVAPEIIPLKKGMKI